MTSCKGNRDAGLVCLISAVLALGTLALYWPALHYQFVSLDDSVYVYSSAMVKRGLTWPGFIWAFKSFDGGNWNPLVWLSHMADCQLYALKPGGHHATNIVLHAANVLLLFFVLKYMTGAIWRSAFVAAIFAWHPMHVESVAWVAERKDVLSTLFWLLCMWTYAAFARAEGSKRGWYYCLTLFSLALGLMCKSMLVTLPAVFLLLDYWPLQRAEQFGKLAIEKLPFVALSLAACALAIWSQQSVGALDTKRVLSLRLENVFVSYAVYVGKLFWPSNMAVFYPFPNSIPTWQPAGAIVLLAIVTWAVVRGMRQRKFLGVGWFWFLGSLVPVIGVVEVGMQAYADRYTYVPYIGLALIISWGLGDLIESWPRGRTILLAATTFALVCSVVAASGQIRFWENNKALYEHALQVTSGNYIAHSNLGNALMDEGKLSEAAVEQRKVISLMPSAAKPYNNLGNIYALQGNMDEAMPLFRKAIALDAALAEAHFNLGAACLRTGRPKEAVDELKVALRLHPFDDKAQTKLVEALLQAGQTAEAISYCEDFVKDNPTDAHVRFNLGWAYQNAKQPDKALANFREAVRLSPETPQCLNAAAWILATTAKAEIRNGPEAVKLATRACELTKGTNVEMLDTLAAAYAEAGQFAAAIKTVREIQSATEDTNMVTLAKQRLNLYTAGKPFHGE